MFDLVINAITGAPIWVWGIFGYLMLVGIKAMQKRSIYIPKLFIIPIIFIILNYKTMISNGDLAAIMSTILIGIITGFLLVRKTPIIILKGKKTVEIPGNYTTLALLMLLFFIKYTFGYLRAAQPLTAIEYSYVEVYISLLVESVLLGRAICYSYLFYNRTNLKIAN